MNEKKQAPHSGKVGRVRYKIWKNTDKAGISRYSVDIFRSLSSKQEGTEAATWRDVHSFSEDDLKLIPLLLSEVESYLASQRSS